MAGKTNDLITFLTEMEDDDVKIFLPNPLAGLCTEQLELTVKRDLTRRKMNGEVLMTFKVKLFGVFLCCVTMKAAPHENVVIWRVE